MFTGFYQMLSQMSDIIDFTFPAPVPWLAEVVKILFLDVRNIIHLGVCVVNSPKYGTHLLCC